MDRLNLFREKTLVNYICYLATFYTFLKTESYISSTSLLPLTRPEGARCAPMGHVLAACAAKTRYKNRTDFYYHVFYNYKKASVGATDQYETPTDQYNYLLTENGIKPIVNGKLNENGLKPVVKGKLGNKEMTLSEVKRFFLTLKNSDPLGKGSDKEFCLLVNGF